MSSFDLGIPIVLRHEGGFVNDPSDPGGATNFGVSLRWLKAQGLLTELEHSNATDDPVVAVQRMTTDEAKAFYQQYWWDAYHYGNIVAQAVANKVFDTAVNLGAPRAHRMLQTIVTPGAVDGILGPITIAKTNAFPSIGLLAAYQKAQADFYRGLVANKPELGKFLQGWLNRAFDRT